jgi:trimethylamine--corrinoid protein Co-methyltransferase
MAFICPSIRIIEEEHYDLVLGEALRILEEVGVKVAGESMRERLFDAGFTADEASGRIRFPADKVRAAIESTPSSFQLYDRDGEPYAQIGGGVTHFAPGSSGLSILDHRTGEHHVASTTDFVDYIKVGHGLRHVRLLATSFSAAEIEPIVSDAWRLYLLLRHTTKSFVSGAFSEHGVPRIRSLMELYRRDAADLAERPMAICTVTAAGSFGYNEDSTQNMVDYVEAGIPVEVVPVTLMALNAPVTLLGALAFHTADALAGVTMAQTVRPGASVLYGGAAATFHMQNTTSPMTAIEALRLTNAGSLMGRHLGLPTQAYTCFGEGKVLDAQAGAETAMGALLAVESGLSAVSGVGMLDYLLTFSLPKLVVDDEIVGQVLHFGGDVGEMGDIPTTDLVRELLDEGHVLVADHTLEHWPSALYLPGPVWDRDDRSTWTGKGGHDIVDRATAQVERLLASYEMPEVDPAVDAEALAIIRSGMSGSEELPAV